VCDRAGARRCDTLTLVGAITLTPVGATVLTLVGAITLALVGAIALALVGAIALALVGAIALALVGATVLTRLGAADSMSTRPKHAIPTTFAGAFNHCRLMFTSDRREKRGWSTDYRGA
jgi:multidrug efflux pump subunit AcrB